MNNNSQNTPPRQFESAEIRCGRCKDRQIHLYDANAFQPFVQAGPAAGSGLYFSEASYTSSSRDSN